MRFVEFQSRFRTWFIFPHSNREKSTAKFNKGTLAKVPNLRKVSRQSFIHCPEKQAQAALVAAQRIFPNTLFPADGQTVTLTADGVISTS
jgi:hypothetical protein